jgi:hypothetical protein
MNVLMDAGPVRFGGGTEATNTGASENSSQMAKKYITRKGVKLRKETEMKCTWASLALA